MTENGTLPEPEPPAPTAADRLTLLEAAQTDTDSLQLDHEYRLTLLELGITE